MTAENIIRIVAHQNARQDEPHVSFDSGKDFLELTQLKIKNPTTGLPGYGGRALSDLLAGPAR